MLNTTIEHSAIRRPAATIARGAGDRLRMAVFILDETHRRAP
jgi:hypothetical protein